MIVIHRSLNDSVVYCLSHDKILTAYCWYLSGNGVFWLCIPISSIVVVSNWRTSIVMQLIQCCTVIISVKNGGRRISEINDADYIFSSSAAAEDTLR